MLLAVIELFADGFWKLGVLLAMDYPILRYGDGLAGMVGDLFQWIGILAIFAVGIILPVSAIYEIKEKNYALCPSIEETRSDNRYVWFGRHRVQPFPCEMAWSFQELP